MSDVDADADVDVDAVVIGVGAAGLTAAGRCTVFGQEITGRGAG